MRNIKFRGFSKNLTNNEWVYGDLVNYSETEKIIVEQNSKTWDLLEGGIIIDEKSIGQFTGLHDKNGKEIYDDDIIKWGMHKGSEEYFHRYAVVEFNPDIQFRILFYVNSETGEKKPTDNYIFHFGKFAYKETDKHIEIIGNVFENADLVKL